MIVADLVEMLASLLRGLARLGTYLGTQSRRTAMRRAAAASGRRFLARAPHLPSARVPFFAMRPGVAMNAVSGVFDGREATVYDYGCGGAKGGTASSAPAIYTCVELELEPVCPPVTITPAAIIEPAANAAIPFESERFNRTWRVRSADPAFAVAAVDARMMEYVLSLEPRYGIDLSGRRLLVRTTMLAPDHLSDLVAAAYGIRERLPAVLLSLAAERAAVRQGS